MSVEIAQKVLNLEEIYSVAVLKKPVKVAKILSNELSDNAPKKIKAKPVDVSNLELNHELLKKEEYLRAFYLITLSQLARMKKAGRKSIVELLSILINQHAIPQGTFDNESGIITSLISALKEGGQVQVNGETKSFADVIEQSQTEDEEEEKKELPSPLKEVTSQELFVISNVDNFNLAVYAVETYRLELLSKRLFVSFGLLIQALKVPADALHPLLLSKGMSTKAAQTVCNSLIALVDKSQALGKSASLGTPEQISSIIKSLISLLQQIQNIGMVLKSEINNDISTLFLEKTSDKIQDFVCPNNTLTQDVIGSLIDVLGEIVDLKLKNLEELNTDFESLNNEYDATLGLSSDEKSARLVSIIDILIKATNLEEFTAYNILKAQDDEMKAKLIKKKEELEAAGKPFKGEIRGLKLGAGTNAYLDYIATSLGDNAELNSYINVSNIDDKQFKDTLIKVTEVSNQERRKPKCAKGTRDMNPLQSAIKEKAIGIIKEVFQKHGASEIDTPVFELRETLTGKYGEESKLIYDLEDQGGELLSLRYDLTVPFARYVAENGISSIKRFHIAKVYRRDQPQMSKGRFREFYQCDFDIAGSSSLMIPDAEVLKVVTDILSSLEVGDFVIKVNHRKFLDSIIELSGCDKTQFKTICSSIDKLDKEPWEKVEHELINVKGLTPEMTAKLGEFVKLKGSPKEMLETLKKEKVFGDHQQSLDTIKEMDLLFEYLEAMNCLDNISFDFSLARGLDYYTGLIYEAILTGEGKVGSIAGGGRYDELVGMFSGQNIPAVGVSIGIERIFVILEEKAKEDASVRATKTQVLVASIGKNMAANRFKICNMLWSNGIKAETLYNDNLKPQKQLKYAFDSGIPLIIWIGEDEIAQNKVKVKILNDREEEEITNDDLVKRIAELVAANPVLTAKEE